MSQPESNEIRVGILSWINIYTVMLGLSLLALLLAITVLVVELSRYDWDTNAQTASRLDRPSVASITVERV